MSDRASITAEERFLRLFLSGDPSASREVERWAEELVRFKGYGFSAEEREDTVQDALADVWKAVTGEGFRLKGHLRGLVRTVATARCIDRMRRRRPTAPLPDALPDDRPSPYDDILRSDESARLRWALQQLHERCQRIIRLRYFEGEAYRRIAGRLEIAEATVRVHMFHCMKSLRTLVARFAP